MAEAREQLLQEAYKLRDLGRYPEAHSFFNRAREQSDDLMLAVDIASTYLEQGNVKKCLEQINIGIETFATSTSDQVVVALAKILQASTVVATTLRFRESLKAGSDLFKKHLCELPVEKYNGKLVALLLAYYYMRGLAELCGFDVSNTPVPSATFIKSLYRYLAASKQYSNAFQIAKLYAAAAGPQQHTELLDELLALEDTPELVQAEALLEETTLLYAADLKDDALSKLQAAMELYQRKKHATGPLLLEVQRFTMLPFGDKHQRQVRRQALFHLKCELERFECYDGMRQALNALYQLAQEEQDDTLRVRLDSEMQRLSSIRGCPMDWISQQLILLNNWKRAGPSTGQMLLSLEALYQDMEVMEAPAVQAGVAHSLAQKYREVGDTAKAEKWTSKSNAEQGIPRCARFLVGTDVFYRVLEESIRAPADEEGELQDLRQELLRVIEDVRPEVTSPNFIHFGIMKVMHMCELYMGKFVVHQLRGFDRTKRLVEACLEFSDTLIQILPPSQKKKWDGTVLTVRARLLSIQADLDLGSSEVLYKAIETYKEAALLFSEPGLELNIAQVEQQMAGCYKELWRRDEYSITSEHFGTVVTMYESAGKVLKFHGTIEQQRLNLFTLMSHWYMGHERGVQYRDGSYQETINCLREAENIFDRERQELSALSHHEAIAAKQNMRQNKSMDLIFETAIKLFGSSGDTKSLWNWVQKSKARSISDQLGLGIILPRELTERIEGDAFASELLTKEEKLAHAVKTADPAAQFLARKALETHQRIMRTNDTLREVLELREGKPIAWKSLHQLHDPHSVQSERSIWFVDWLTIENQIFLIAVPNRTEAYSFYKIDMTLADVDQWIKRNLDCEEALNDLDGLASLKELSDLIDPLVHQNLTKEGDLLVLCMTGILHRVPVHAAVISGNPEDDSSSCKTLIERNPIIYTSSITITQQCTTRATTRTMDHVTGQGEHQQGTVLSIYEHGDIKGSTGWESERENIYQTCRDLATQMQWGDAFCGIDAGRARFIAACESSIVHFSGHFNYEKDILDHGIELALLGVSGEDSSALTDAHAPPHNRVLSEDIFSVKDIFCSEVKASHFSLIACASAKQKVQKGDEPLGMVTALLYAGATSVAGTLWPIASGAGRVFTRLFYEKFRSVSSEGCGRTIDLAIALQETVRDMRKNGHLEEPYNWAGFTLHGTWLYSGRV